MTIPRKMIRVCGAAVLCMLAMLLMLLFQVLVDKAARVLHPQETRETKDYMDKGGGGRYEDAEQHGRNGHGHAAVEEPYIPSNPTIGKKWTLNHDDDDDDDFFPETHRNPEFVLVLCRDPNATKKNSGNDFQRHLRQIAVLLKSAAALTSRTLKFHVVSDSLTTHHSVTNLTEDWPSAYRQRVVFGEYKEVFYPPGTEKIRKMFRPCSTERLFLAHAYEDKDTLVFLDTDILFLRPPEDLWSHINNFEREQIIGIAPCLYMYGPGFRKFPTYGSSGLNAGVLLMNLTRIRAFAGGWTEAIMAIVDKYGRKLSLGDQDILNVLFSSKERAAQLYELGCEWNYRRLLCSEKKDKCSYAHKVGVGLLHGAAMTFFHGQERKFETVFNAWEQYQLDAPLLAFANGLNSTLKQQRKAKGCARMPGIDEMLLKGLMDTVKKKELAETDIN